MSVPMPTPGYHDPDTLRLIDQAFDKAWGELTSRGLARDTIGLSKLMSRRIMGAVLVGVRDLDRLTLLALDAVDQNGFVQPRDIERLSN